jgi:hypothetical protein
MCQRPMAMIETMQLNKHTYWKIFPTGLELQNHTNQGVGARNGWFQILKFVHMKGSEFN